MVEEEQFRADCRSIAIYHPARRSLRRRRRDTISECLANTYERRISATLTYSSRLEDLPIDGEIFVDEDVVASRTFPTRRLMIQREKRFRVEAGNMVAQYRSNRHLDSSESELQSDSSIQYRRIVNIPDVLDPLTIIP